MRVSDSEFIFISELTTSHNDNQLKPVSKQCKERVVGLEEELATIDREMNELTNKKTSLSFSGVEKELM